MIVLAQTLGGFTGSTDTLGRAYTEITENLGKLAMPPFVYSSGLAVTTASPRFNYPSSGIEVLAVFYEARQLRPARRHELDIWDSTWRGSTSNPFAFEKEEGDYNTIRMVPAPTTATTGAWLYTKSPDEIPDYIALYIAYKMLEREFARISAHQDKELAAVCGQMAQMFALLIGL